MLDGGNDAGDETQEVSVTFEARVGAEAFDCNNTYSELGSSKVKATFNDFRFYIYDVRLVNEAGEEVSVSLTQGGDFQYQDVALLDFEDNSGNCQNGTEATNQVITGTVPAGSYTGVRFGLGVPDNLNHTDFATQPAPLNLSGMAWPWLSGRQFMRADTQVVVSSGARPVFFVHLGSSMCTGSPAAGNVTCARPNRPAIELDHFDAERDKVVFDYAKLIEDVALDADKGGAKGCMVDTGDPECDSILGKLGVDTSTGMPSKDASQSVFSVEAK
jgi:uncharacterized repeat protein (TIGR04052 family)